MDNFNMILAPDPHKYLFLSLFIGPLGRSRKERNLSTRINGGFRLSSLPFHPELLDPDSTFPLVHPYRATRPVDKFLAWWANVSFGLCSKRDLNNPPNRLLETRMEFEDDESEELIVPFVPWFCYHDFQKNCVKIIFEKVVKISLLFLQSLKYLPISLRSIITD